MSKLTMLKLAFVAFVTVFAVANASDMEMDKVEDSTVSPIADMAIIDAEMKTSTERPPVMEAPKQEEKPASQRHTVADFIIHPLIAFKPRNPEDDGIVVAGKQANNGGQSSTTTTPSPWQLFGFNAGQGLGSQVTNLAGQVSGWLNDRIQFPGLVETPVRESTTTSTSTTSTPRPDVVVRVQHRPSTRRPLLTINNRNRPNRPQFESEENDDEDEDNDNDNDEDNDEENNSGEATDDNESSNEVQEGNGSEEEEEDDDHNKDEDEHGDDEDEEDHSQRPNNKRRPLRNNNNNKNRNGQRRRGRPQQQGNRRRVPNRRRQQAAPHRRRPAPANDASDEEVQDDDEYENNDDFYYGSRPSTKRSQSNSNFIQRGQQQLLNQIRQLTRGQTPGEIGASIRKAQRVNAANNRRRQQATLLVNRNGQTIYVAPELAPMAAPQYQQIYAQPIMQKPVMTSAYPQPPLTVPLKRKGQPTQYITIPWAQLGISPPNNIVSITEGIQAQPLILNIPQSAINTMQAQAAGRPKKKRPQLITAEAVPLLAEASLMDIFKPPQIPPSRHTGSSKPTNVANATPVIVSAKPSSSTKTSNALLHQHIRPGTIIEKAPEMDAMKKAAESDSQTDEGAKIDMLRGTGEKEFILVGHDEEPGLTRQVEPVFGDARYVRLTGNSDYYDVLPRRRFTVRRGGRELAQPADMPDAIDGDKTEQLIPVQIVNEPEVPSYMGESAKIASSESETSQDTPAMEAELSDPKPAPVAESSQQSTEAKMTTT